MVKAFEKQTKNNWRLRKEQVNNLKTLKPIEEDKSDDNEKLLKYKEIFKELSNKKMSEIQELSEKNDFKNLTSYFTNPNLPLINFIGFRRPLDIYNEVKNGNISILKGEEDQNKFKSSLSDITTENPKYKKQYQLDAIENIKNLSNSRKKAI